MARNRQLVAAINQGHVEEVERCVAEGQDVNKADPDGNRPLHHAASTGNGAIVKKLLAAGANSNGRGYEQATPLMRARSVDVGRLLLESGAELEAVDAEGLTPLMHAANLDVPELVRLLIDRGAKIDARSNVGASALIYAIYSRGMDFADPEPGDVVDQLLAAGADINVKDNEGMTALAIARQCEGRTYVKYLKSKGAK